jgi:transcriptional regulator with XRE-family HTH domain
VRPSSNTPDHSPAAAHQTQRPPALDLPGPATIGYPRGVSTPSHPLLAVRERTGLSREEMASLVGLATTDVADLETGPTYVPPEVIERYAVALGLSVRELLQGEEPSAVALLFRRIQRESRSIGALGSAETHRALGDFVRCAREHARLRLLLDDGPRPEQLRWLTTIESEPILPRPELYGQARRLASLVRGYLGLDHLAVIASMRKLVEDLGIVTMFVEPEQLDPQIEGASLLNPHPAMLVNLVGGGDHWWRTRMIMAHELCHIFFDRSALNAEDPRRFFVFSPYRPESRPGTAWHLFDHFEDLEARANAFAGDLLAPTRGVEHLIGARDPTTLDAINRISDHYQIGNETAINRLQNTFRLSRDHRSQMLSRLAMARATGGRRIATPTAHDDCVNPGAQLRDATFIDLVLRACQAGRLDEIEARAQLNLRLSEPLPSSPRLAPTPAQLAPAAPGEASARRAAERHLYRHVGLDYFVQSLAIMDGVWHATISRRTPEAAATEVGALSMSSDLTLLAPIELFEPTNLRTHSG